MTINQIINNFKDNNPGADTTMIQLAYDFAVKAHSGQKRKSGEPYIQHSLHTAFVLTQIKADLATVIAGLLHDVPEDTEYTLSDIEKNFGKEVADLVEGITKLSKIKYRGIERYRESLRKMFLAMAQDIRVILIKFADRLHNLRTLESLPLEKRQRIARETLEIYAPIAGLLGIARLKWQMEDICFKHLYPEDYKKLAYKYEVEKKLEHNQYIQKVKNILGAKLREAKIAYHITSRFKHLYSIYLKLQKKDRKFDEIYDVFALRITVPDIADCYKTLGIIHSLWRPNPGRLKDYIAVPKPNGYQALHTTVYGPEGKSTEFQIRTKEMDEGAKYGIAAHWSYKMGSGSDLKKQPAWVKEVLNIQKETENTSDFIKQIKFDVFHDRIFVFTPKGDVFDLPEGSTPIDFAYYVHSDIGNRATGARINDNISTLDKELKNGDLVEIITEKKRKGPNRDWLKFVKTATARNKIKQNLNSTMIDNLKKFIPKI
jgi:GTP diphosphokinase / guanosine-3',5'-bis(diphosphate) 3'-diphosphatase